MLCLHRQVATCSAESQGPGGRILSQGSTLTLPSLYASWKIPGILHILSPFSNYFAQMKMSVSVWPTVNTNGFPFLSWDDSWTPWASHTGTRSHPVLGFGWVPWSCAPINETFWSSCPAPHLLSSSPSPDRLGSLLTYYAHPSSEMSTWFLQRLFSHDDLD